MYFLYVAFDPSSSSRETKKSQRDRAVLHSHVDLLRLQCAVSECVLPCHDNCPRCKQHLCSDHFEDDHSCEQLDNNGSSESNSASSQEPLSNIDLHRLQCAVPECVLPSFDNCPRCKQHFCADHFNDAHFCEQFDNNDSFESNSASNQVPDAPAIPPSDAFTDAPKLSVKHLKELIKSCLLKFKFFGYKTNKKCCQIAESSDVINFPIGAVISEINGEVVDHYNTNQLHYVLSRCSSSTIFKVHLCIYIYIYVYIYFDIELLLYIFVYG
jgi:hypothetical protein